MKVTIEYDGDEEREELFTALNGSRWKGAVWDLDQELRKITKYGYVDQREATSEETALAEILRIELRNILQDYNLNLE
jgi:hypothetical protein